MNGAPALEVSALSVRIDGAAVVDGVDLTVGAGERVALAGESGCGKSTTALAVMGLLPSAARLAAGRVRIAGHDLYALREPERRALRGGTVGLVSQEAGAALNPVIPVGRQLEAVVRRVTGMGRRGARHRAAALLEEVGIGGARATARPHELSGGQCQRVMIAMALGCEPAVLVADEPTSALDVTTQARVMDRLLDMTRRRGTALLLITHDLALAATRCERALVMYCGRIVESAPVGALLRRPEHPYSAGLLAALPRVRGPRRTVTPIAGGPPPPDALPPGCHFEPRCPRATGRCREARPRIGDDGRGRAACFHPLGGGGDE